MSVLQALQAELANTAIEEDANLPDQPCGDSPDGLDDEVLGQSLLETVTGQALLK